MNPDSKQPVDVLVYESYRHASAMLLARIRRDSEAYHELEESFMTSVKEMVEWELALTYLREAFVTITHYILDNLNRFEKMTPEEIVQNVIDSFSGLHDPDEPWWFGMWSVCECGNPECRERVTSYSDLLKSLNEWYDERERASDFVTNFIENLMEYIKDHETRETVLEGIAENEKEFWKALEVLENA